MNTLLKKHFGYDDFRPMQEEIINNILEKKDTLVLMPTGGGKSICFQLPALKFEGLTLVISPLISLMKDQVDSLKLNGINAECINSTLTDMQIEDIKEKIVNKEIKMLYLAPERLALKSFKNFISKVDVSLIAIDEAHCISQWGHDFRQDYTKLKFLKEEFSGVPIIALTATATSEVKEDILKQLNLDKPKIFTSSFDRENLNLIIRNKKNSFAQILALVEKNRDESIIIYCHSRKDTLSLTEGLNKYGFKALAYHAGLSTKIREKNQDLFINDKVNIIVATIAFGMGIDKSNVRLIIHNTFSKSIEAYYQEIGRAGRDGLPSDCILFYSKSDEIKHKYFIDRMTNRSLRVESNKKLNEITTYCEGMVCRRKYILEYFGEEFLGNCLRCDICLNLPTNITPEKVSIKKYDSALFNELKTLRKEIGTLKNVSPSNVFSDLALRKMATSFPKTEKEFSKISGVGEEKLKDFGEDFLIIINEHLRVNEIANNLSSEGIVSKKKVVKKKKYYTKKKYTKTKYKKKKK